MELIPISKATWDAFGNRAFCQICAEEVGAGNRPLGCLNTRGYKNLQQKFFERTGKKHDKKQLKNKWETLKKEYNLWNDLKQKATGLGWDHKKGTISASDAWWKEHKQYPKHFRYGPPENLDDMDRMFDKAHVTSNTSAIPGEPTQEDQTVVDIDCAEDGEEDAAADGENIEVVCTQPKVVAKRRANNINPSTKKNNKNPIARDFKRMVDIMAKGPVQSGPSIADAMDVAIQVGVVPGSDEHFIATRLFTKLENREVFVTMKTDEVNMNWLRRMFDLKMKKD